MARTKVTAQDMARKFRTRDERLAEGSRSPRIARIRDAAREERKADALREQHREDERDRDFDRYADR